MDVCMSGERPEFVYEKICLMLPKALHSLTYQKPPFERDVMKGVHGRLKRLEGSLEGSESQELREAQESLRN